MKIDGKDTRTIWVESDGQSVGIIDQTQLPHRFVTAQLASLADSARAIRTMQVRGAPLIGATAACGMWLALREDASDEALERAYSTLMATRPTAINLRWALNAVDNELRALPPAQRADRACRRRNPLIGRARGRRDRLRGHGRQHRRRR